MYPSMFLTFPFLFGLTIVLDSRLWLVIDICIKMFVAILLMFLFGFSKPL